MYRFILANMLTSAYNKQNIYIHMLIVNIFYRIHYYDQNIFRNVIYFNFYQNENDPLSSGNFRNGLQ